MAITSSDYDTSFNTTYKLFQTALTNYLSSSSIARSLTDFIDMPGYTYGSMTDLYYGSTGSTGSTGSSMSKSACVTGCINTKGCIGTTYTNLSDTDGICYLNNYSSSSSYILPTQLLSSEIQSIQPIATLRKTDYYFNLLTALNEQLIDINTNYQQSIKLTTPSKIDDAAIQAQMDTLESNNKTLQGLSDQLYTQNNLYDDSSLLLTQQHVKFFSTFFVLFIVFIIFKLVYFPSIIVDIVLFFLAIVVSMFLFIQIHL